jgi:hypothetical protein
MAEETHRIFFPLLQGGISTGLEHHPGAIMVERYPHRPRWWEVALPPQYAPLPVHFRFLVQVVTIPGTDFVVRTPEEHYMEVAGEAPAQVCFQCDAQTCVLLAYGRLSPSSACAAGLLTATGSAP